MENEIKLIVYPVKDLEKAKVFYSQFLGIKPYIDSPHYVGYTVGDMEVGLDPNATVGPIVYKYAEDIEASLKEMIDAGAKVVQEITTIVKGLRIAQIKDSSGNIVGLTQQTGSFEEEFLKM